MTFNAGALPVSIVAIMVCIVLYRRRYSLLRASDTFWNTHGRTEKSLHRAVAFTTVMCVLTLIGAVLILVLPLWG